MSCESSTSRKLVADEVVDRLHVELRGEPFLHAVDDRELGSPLLGFLQQALGLVEQAGVLQRRAQRGGDGGQQAQLRFVVGVLALEVVEAR